MKYKAKVKAFVEMIVWINEDIKGDIEIDEIVETTEIIDFENVRKIS